MSLVVFGSVGLDDVETPSGRVQNVVGGSAVYFSLAASLFTRSDEVDHAWRYVTALLDGWAGSPPPSFPNYYPFTDGPDEANRLLGDTNARWRALASM